MNDKILIGVVDRDAHALKQLQPRGHIERARIAVLVDGVALDVIHHQVRQAVLGRAAIEIR